LNPAHAIANKNLRSVTLGLTHSLPVVGILFGVLGAAGCTSTPADPGAAYVATLQKERAAKDEAFRRQIDQPVPADRQQTYLPLKYFPVDPAYAVTASFTPAPARTPLQMPTSTGKLRDVEQVGTLAFTLKGQALSLGAFVEVGDPPNRLFVPFTDLTSGTETYPAGRYLELDRTVTGIYVIDFNRAFHPYCYYNDSYDCPYPPPANRLPIPVRAGEKLAQSNIPSAGRN
jgi:uncharacterized protein (DUF1684 family)